MSERAEERIRELALLFDVPDGGRYLNDWRARREAFDRDAAERDTLRAQAREDARILHDIATALRETAEQWPTPNRYSEQADAILADLASEERVG